MRNKISNVKNVKNVRNSQSNNGVRDTKDCASKTKGTIEDAYDME